MKQITVLLSTWLTAVLRRTWLVAAITVVSCAVFAARAASSLAAVELTVAPPAPVAVTPRAAARRAAPDGAQLVARNMFCSQCGPAAVGSELALSGAVLIETSLGAEPRATVRVLATDAQGSWGLGDAVPGLGRLERIAPTWVAIVDAAGHRGRLSLLEGAPVPLGPADVAASPWAGKLRQLDETTFEVDRALVRELVTGITKPGAARFVPILEHGQLAGLRLLGVTKDSLPAALGLQSRDTVTAIDGAPITNIQQGIDLFARLDQVSAVELSGKRDGKPLVRTFRLR